MKVILLLLGIVAVASASSIAIKKQDVESIYKELLEDFIAKHNTRNAITVNVNEYLDSTLEVVRLWIIRNGMDPIEVDALEKGFSIWVGFIKWHGEFALNHGWMQGLNTVQRAGDASMTYDTKILQVYMPITFETILVNYDYKIKFMNLGPSGGVEGKIKNLKVIVDIAVDTATLELTLQGFSISDAGKISIRFSGNPLVDILTNVITGLATTMLHGVAVGVIQNQVREALQDAIDAINNGLHPNPLLY